MERLRDSAALLATARGIPTAHVDLNYGSAVGRLPALDGLRGIAAIGVVIFHCYPRYGFWMGSFVDLFFAISGFVITRMLIAAPAGTRVSLRNFWARRILRIWPVYFLVVGGGLLVLGLHTLLTPGFDVPDAWWKCLFFVQFTEWYGPDPQPMFAFFRNYPLWLGHSWSLAVEEQFYLLWPLVLLLCRGAWSVALVCLAITAASIYANVSEWPGVTLATRSIGLALGSLLAVVELRLGTQPGGIRLRAPVALACGAAFCTGLLLEAPRMAARYVGTESWEEGPPSVRAYDLLAFNLIYAGLVGWLVFIRHGMLARILSAPTLVYLGGISYAIYMFHFPLMAVVGRTGITGWPSLYAISLPEHVAFWSLLLGLAHLSRRWLELPFNERKHDYPLYVPQSPQGIAGRQRISMMSAP